MKTEFAFRKSGAVLWTGGLALLFAAVFVMTTAISTAVYATEVESNGNNTRYNYRNLYATEEDNVEPVKSNDTNLILCDLDGSIAYLNSGDYVGKIRVVIAGRPTCGNTNRMINEAIRLSKRSKYEDVRFVILDVDGNREAFMRAYADKESKNVRFFSPTSDAGVSYNSWCWAQYRTFSSNKNVMLPFMFLIDKKGNLVKGTAGPIVLTSLIDEIESGTYLFSDVAQGEWYANDEVIGYVVKNKLMKGYENTNLFGPNDGLSRGQVAVILHRMAGEPKAASTSFSDVDEKAYYASAIAWAKATGVVNGFKDVSGRSVFAPDSSVTREQFATMLANYGERIANQSTTGSPSSLDSYGDASSVASWAVSSLSWAVERGIISGSVQNDRSFLNPQGITTRAQAAKMIAMAHKNVFTAPEGALK